MTAPLTTSAEKLSNRICLSFGVGTVGVSIMLNAVTSYYPAFLSTVLGQSPEVAGYLMMASKLYDAVVDVLIGTWSDATRSRWGRRRPFLLAGALCSAVAFFMLFAPPVLSQTALILYMIAAQMLYSTAYSLFNVPYMAMPAELTHGYHERTRLLSFRTVFVSIGQLLAMAGTAAIIKQGGGNASAYAMMGLVMALVIGGAMTATALGTPPIHGPLVASHASHHPERAKIWPQLKLMTRNRPYMLLLGAKVFQFLAFASIGSTALLYMLNVLGVGYSGQIWLAITQNVVSAASMPLWVRLGKGWASATPIWWACCCSAPPRSAGCWRIRASTPPACCGAG
jgi:GPH family glycoside/pentoside/hexuronide:cation symporter